MNPDQLEIDIWWKPTNPDDKGGLEALHLGSVRHGESKEFSDRATDDRVDCLIVSYPLLSLDGLVHRISTSKKDDDPSGELGLNVDEQFEARVMFGERTDLDNEREGRPGLLILYLMRNKSKK